MAHNMFPVPRDAQATGATDVKWFAGLAMQAIIAQRGVPESEAVREEIALWSYRMGQSMVAVEQTLHVSDE